MYDGGSNTSDSYVDIQIDGKEIMIMKSTHGGDWAGYEIEYGKEPLDFSMNVNPLGMPGGVEEAIAAAAAKADRYPDPDCRRLSSAIAAYEGVPAEWIFCGNGAADIIDRIASALKKDRDNTRGSGGEGTALVTAPTFSEYEHALFRCGWQVDHHRLDEETFRITEDVALNMMAENSDVIFLCEPNNPTGITTDRKILEKIVEDAERTGSIIVIDECFNGFLDEPGSHTMKGALRDHPDLIILKAFTKLYGMAGVRLGYCLCSDEEKINRIRRAGQPWNVSYLAEEAGLAALKETGYIERTQMLIGPERRWLTDRLRELGIEKIFGEANYILFRWPGDWPEDTLDSLLRKRGILIRSCSNYEGLDEGWYRIAVRKHEENEIIVEALKELRG